MYLCKLLMVGTCQKTAAGLSGKVSLHSKDVCLPGVSFDTVE